MKTSIISALALLALGSGLLQAQQAAPPEELAPRSMISLDSARTLALRHVLGNDGIKSARLKDRDGVPQYEIAVETPGAGYRQLRIDPRTGMILADRYQDDFFGTIGTKLFKAKDKRAYRMDFSYDSLKTRKEVVETEVAKISEEQARTIALRRIPNGIITEVSLTRNDQTIIWKVAVDPPGEGSRELLIDANNGVLIADKTRK